MASERTASAEKLATACREGETPAGDLDGGARGIDARLAQVVMLAEGALIAAGYQAGAQQARSNIVSRGIQAG